MCLKAIKKGPGHSSHPCPITAHTETSHPTGQCPSGTSSLYFPPNPTLSSIRNPARPSFAWPPHPPWPMLTSRRHASLLRAWWHTYVMALCWRPNQGAGHQCTQRQGGDRVTDGLGSTSAVMGTGEGPGLTLSCHPPVVPRVVARSPCSARSPPADG